MKRIYKWRGFILGLLALGLFISPAAALQYGPTITAATLLVLGILLRIFARRTIGEHTRGVVHAAPTLVTTGAYSLMRHPLYVSNTLIASGAIFFHLGFELWALPFLAVLFSLEFALSKAEDRFLEGYFQDEWKYWKARTWAFFPNPRNFRPTPQPRSFFQSLWADRSTWLWVFLLIFVLYGKKVFLGA